MVAPYIASNNESVFNVKVTLYNYIILLWYDELHYANLYNWLACYTLGVLDAPLLSRHM